MQAIPDEMASREAPELASSDRDVSIVCRIGGDPQSVFQLRQQKLFRLGTESRLLNGFHSSISCAFYFFLLVDHVVLHIVQRVHPLAGGCGDRQWDVVQQPRPEVPAGGGPWPRRTSGQARRRAIRSATTGTTKAPSPSNYDEYSQFST
jgi:hypothetical protein